MTDKRHGIARVADVTQRLAVLLAAGVAPASAWGYLREGEPAGRIATRIAAGADIPDSIVAELSGIDVLESDAWRGLATAWAVASEVGAPIAPTLRDFAASLREFAQARREIGVALAAPRATARLVTALPIVGALFGAALGFNTLGTLFTTVPGLGCLGGGVGLMILASRWNRRLIRAAEPVDVTPGLELDLTAIAVSGGGSLDRARATVASAIERYSARAIAVPADIHGAALDAVLELSSRAGVPAASLLRSEATELRRESHASLRERTEALSVRLMLPLGICVLPAFMLLGVAPLLLTVISTSFPA